MFIVQNVEGTNSSISLSKTIHPELNSPFKLGISDDAMIENGPQIIILDIEDSRCPSDVTCVWAGEAKVSVDIIDRKSTRLNSSHIQKSRMPSSA